MKRSSIVGLGLVALMALQSAFGDSYQELAKYKHGDSRAALVAIEAEMRSAPVTGYAAIEEKLLAVLRMTEATLDAKTFVCRCLRQIGSAKCVPAVAPLLADEKLSHMARWALQGNDTAEAGKALRDALVTVKGNQLVGVISSVGERRDAQAVGALSDLAKDADAAVAGAAMSALGRIGGAAAAKALEAITPSETLQKAWVTGYLGCAEKLAAADAGRMYRRVFDGKFDMASRVAALVGLARAQQIKADELVALMKGNDASLQVAAARLIGESKDTGMVKAAIAALPSLSPAIQVVVISGFGATGNTAAAAAVAGLAESADVNVSMAALEALSVIGDASHLPLLLRVSQGKGPAAEQAFASLTRLRGDKVDAALRDLLKSQNPSERVKAIEAFSARMDRRRAPDILASCRDGEREVRIAAYKALRGLADDKMLAALADELVAAKPGTELNEMEQTLIAVALRAQSADAASTTIAARLGKSPDADSSLLTALAKRGGAKALEAVRQCVASSDADRKKAAVRAMAVWADTAPLKDLMNLMQNDPDAANRVLALRGYVRLVGDSTEPAAAKVKMLQAALDATQQPDAMKQILSGFGNVKEVVALKVVAGYLDNPAVANEAAAAALSISRELIAKKKSQDKEILDTLNRIQKSTTIQADLRKQAGRLLEPSAASGKDKPKKKK